MTISKALRLRVRPVALTGRQPSLATGVSGVIGASTKSQMLWSDASPHVATVKHFEANRDFPIGQFPCCSVCVDEPATISFDLSVAATAGGLKWHGGTSPQPALSLAVNMPPEPHREGDTARLLRACRRAESVSIVRLTFPIGLAVNKSAAVLADEFHLDYKYTRAGLNRG